MPKWSIATQSIYRVHQSVLHDKFTIIRLVITIIFLHNMFGINIFVTSEHNPIELPITKNPNNLGPKIISWDDQRAEWLSKNPNFPNFIAPNKPRVLLVTESPPKPCTSSPGDHYILKSIKNKIDYCRIHGIEIFYNMALLDEEMPGYWHKIPLLKRLLLSHPEFEFFWWLDNNAMFTDMAFEVPWKRYKDSNLILHRRSATKNQIELNSGSFLLRNCQWSLDLLDNWAKMGPKARVSQTTGPKTSLIYEGDDQSSMAYLITSQREKLGARVYIESEYNLDGDWAVVVDRFEEMMEKYRPGFGDYRWPLVTRFGSCRICERFGRDDSLERCLKEMDRAFIFGDNQVVQAYGFGHGSLDSHDVERVRGETSRPLDEGGEDGFLHHRFKSC